MELRKTILATITYHDRLDYPLTLFEAHHFLINPRRISQKIPGIDEITIGEVARRLDELIGVGAIEERWGMYFLKGRSALCAERLSREKVAAQKWKKFLRAAYWLQAAPWVRGMFASGSMALSNTTESSDFDVLTVIESGRLYLGRLFLSGLASLLGVRRTRYQLSAPDKLCFNHYITTGHLAIPHQSLFNAQTYARLVPLWPHSSHLIGEFFAANLWISRYVYNFKPRHDVIGRGIAESHFLRSVAIFFELLLSDKLGDMLEAWAKKYQQRRIAGNPATHAAGGRVVYTDHELEFHPRSFERTVLDSYNDALQKMAISPHLEPDSGLK